MPCGRPASQDQRARWTPSLLSDDVDHDDCDDDDDDDDDDDNCNDDAQNDDHEDDDDDYQDHHCNMQRLSKYLQVYVH